MVSLRRNCAIMMLYKNMKAMVHSPDSDTNFFDFCCWSLARRYISTMYVYNLLRLRTMTSDLIKENGFTP